MHPKYTPIAERFWPKVDRSNGPNKCWLWTGALHSSGYGLIHRGGRGNGNIRTHRLAWELTNGPIPPGLHVCHRCDNPQCVNPAHLFLGTRSDNMRDMFTKGRNVHTAHPETLPRGERHGRTHLTEDNVRTIRRRAADGETFTSLANEFRITRVAIRYIVQRVSWAHVD